MLGTLPLAQTMNLWLSVAQVQLVVEVFKSCEVQVAVAPCIHTAPGAIGSAKRRLRLGRSSRANPLMSVFLYSSLKLRSGAKRSFVYFPKQSLPLWGPS